MVTTKGHTALHYMATYYGPLDLPTEDHLSIARLLVLDNPSSLIHEDSQQDVPAVIAANSRISSPGE